MDQKWEDAKNKLHEDEGLHIVLRMMERVNDKSPKDEFSGQDVLPVETDTKRTGLHPLQPLYHAFLR